MTEEQKEILIAKMLDAPSSLSDEELDLIFNDNELHDIYNVSAAVSRACIRQPEFDLKAEWNKFRPRLHRKPTVIRRAMRVAAIFLGVFLASGAAVKIIDNLSTDDRHPAIAQAEQSPETDSRPATLLNTTETKPGAKEPERKQTIVTNHTSTDKRHLAKAKTSQSNRHVSQIEPEVDVDEYLRIQQARVDNDLAMQAAESYMREYDDLVAFLDAVEAHNPELDNMIKQVTME